MSYLVLDPKFTDKRPDYLYSGAIFFFVLGIWSRATMAKSVYPQSSMFYYSRWVFFAEGALSVSSRS